LLAAIACGPAAKPAAGPGDTVASDVATADAADTGPADLGPSDLIVTTDVAADAGADAASGCTCGDGSCVATGGCGETVATCPADCATCGDNVCSPGEGPKTCFVDCCGACGDGLCKGYDCGENPTKCPSDCGTACGNKVCDKGESPSTCAEDCKHQVCGNKVCEPEDGGPKTCPEDCGTACGNCVCDKGESWVDCPGDCGFCGDDVCSPCAGLGESKQSCPSDCLSDTCKTASACDDQLTCTMDGCDSAGNCVHLTDQAVCGDGISCTTDVCMTGNTCQHLVKADGAACEDGSACTLGDTCKTQVCLPGTVTTCDDGNPCTTDTCDPAKGCKSVPGNDGGACSDGKACTAGTCSGGSCTTKPLVCGGNGFCVEPGGCQCAADYLTIDVDGAVACAADYPFWGIRPESPLAEWFISNGDGTITDNQSQLMWQKADSGANVNWTNAKSYCANFAQAGKTDWRLPTVAELQTLLDYAKSKPAVAAAFASSTSSADYWTANAVVGVAGNAWQVGMAAGAAYFDVVTATYRARCVRPLAAMPPPAKRFEVYAVEGLVRDYATDRIWQRDGSIGGSKNWSDAQAYCANLTTGGDNWRLPTLMELRSIVDRSAYNPTIAANVFTNTPTGDLGYWSNTTLAGAPTSAWYVNFYNGYNNYFDGSTSHRVRCVRDGSP